VEALVAAVQGLETESLLSAPSGKDFCSISSHTVRDRFAMLAGLSCLVAGDEGVCLPVLLVTVEAAYTAGMWLAIEARLVMAGVLVTPSP
jgi:hypothetical protein